MPLCPRGRLVSIPVSGFTVGQSAGPLAEVAEKLKNKGVVDRYADLFTGIGEMAEKYEMHIDETVRPEQQPPRKLPIAKLDKLKATLEDL